METEEKQVYTVQEIMRILGISKNTAYKFVQESPPFKVLRVGNTYRIHKKSFDEWFLKNE